jgi:hypothetical protein
MRPLKSHFPAHALATLETVLKQTQEARGFRRAQAIREVVAGHHVNAVSATFHFTNSALRTMKRSCGALPCPAPAGGGKPNGLAGPYAR